MKAKNSFSIFFHYLLLFSYTCVLPLGSRPAAHYCGQRFIIKTDSSNCLKIKRLKRVFHIKLKFAI